MFSEHSRNSSEEIPARQVVVQYNYARVLDELCEYKKARRIYRQILMVCPSFIEAHLCSALFLWRTGKFKECIAKLEEAIRKAGEAQLVDVQLNAMLYLHRLYTQIGDREQASKTLKRIDEFRKQTTLSIDIQNDEYSELTSANFMLSMNARTRHHSHAKQYYERVHHALRRFQQVLVTNPNNVFAVHGFGVIAAEAAELSVAKSILSKLRDCFSASSEACTADMMVNLGHVYCAYQQWDIALKCYERAKKKLSPHQAGDIPLYIVRALFAKKDFATAKLRLQQLLRFNPTQELYLFNLALIEEEHACDILRKDARRRTLWEVENVMQMLDNAKKLYKRLDANNKRFAGVARVGGIPQDKLTQHLNHIRSELMENATKHLEFQRAEQLKKEKKRQTEQKKLDKMLERERRDRQQQELDRLRQRQQLKQKALDAKVKGSQILIELPEQNGGGGGRGNNNGPRKRKRGNKNGETPELEPPPTKRAKLGEAFDDEDPMQQFMSNEDGAAEYEVDAQRNRFHVDDDDEDGGGGGDIGMLDAEHSEKKRLKKKEKKKKKKKKDSKDKTADLDPQILAQLEAKVEEIVANSNLDSLTPRQVKDQIAAAFPDVNIKLYKKIIGEYIQEAAKKKQAEVAS